MKTLLIATDFSCASASAADYALEMACFCRWNLVILHVYSPPIPMVAEGTVLDQDRLYDLAERESLQKLSVLSDKLTNSANHLLGTDFQPSIQIISIIGVPSVAIKSFSFQNQIDMIVMGIKPERYFAGILPGSTIRSLIKSSRVPILLIPRDFPALRPRHIAFASTFGEFDFQALTLLAELARDCASDLLIFHNLRPMEKGRIFIAQEKQFLDRIAIAIDYPKIFYRRKHKHTLLEAVEALEKNDDLDILAMVHKGHKLIGQIFGADLTLRMISRTQVPLLIFPQGNSKPSVNPPFTSEQTTSI